MVAKIFNPLYYDFRGGFDVPFFADQHYSCEAAAYQKLCEAKVDGAFSPKYHGTWL